MHRILRRWAAVLATTLLGQVCLLNLAAPRAAALETATYWPGVTRVWNELGITGDGDGDPNTYTNKDITIAIVDTGIDANHVDLQGKVVAATTLWGILQDDPHTPSSSHGTHVAGIAAGSGRGHFGRRGVAPGAALVSIKFAPGEAAPPNPGTTEEPPKEPNRIPVIDDVLEEVGAAIERTFIDELTLHAVDWVLAHHAEHNIRVVNFSLKGSPSPLHEAELALKMRLLEARGIVVVKSAGNRGPYTQSIGFPGDNDSVITVGATTDPGHGAETLALFSSRGDDGLLKPDIAAPGWLISAPRQGTSSDYVTSAGTSMATPFVSGVVALMLAANPDLRSSQVKQILQQTADRYPGLAYPNPHLGHGVVNAYEAVRVARGLKTATAGPSRPDAYVFTGTLPDPKAGRVRHTIDLPADTWGVGVTVWTDRWDPPSDFRHHLYYVEDPPLPRGMTLHVYGPSEDPGGAETLDRQEFRNEYPMALFRPTTPGTYTLELERNFDSEDTVSGEYTLVVTTHRGPPVSGDFGGHNIPRHMRADEVSLVDVTAINTGHQDWNPQSPRPLAISYHWLDEYGNPVIWEGLTSPVVVTVAPGQAVTQKVAVRAPAVPGRYLLELDLVQVGQEWLSCLGSGRVIVGVNVTP